MKQELNKKISITFKIISLILLALIIKLSIIVADPNLKNKANKQQFIKVNIINRRGDIIDRNNRKILNCEKIYKAFVLPKDEVFSILQENAKNITKEKLEQLIKKRKPFVVEIKNPKLKNENIKIFEDYKRYPTSLSYPVQLIGFCNEKGDGVMGIEKTCNDFLKENGVYLDAYIPAKIDINSINMKDIIFKDKTNNQKPLKLTIDNEEQYTLYRICRANMEQGSAVQVDLKTGEILAFCSIPTFSPQNLKKDLNNINQPFINRPTLNYPIGSIFKIVTAAAALEQGIKPDYKYKCSGKYKYKDTIYRCHQREGHGELDMKNAMKNSCNPYFINIARKIGKKKMIQMAQKLGLNSPIKIDNIVNIKKSEMPPENMSQGELCNFAFGQGIVKTSMLHIAQMFLKIFNSQNKNTLRLIARKENENTREPIVGKKELNKIIKGKRKILQDLLSSNHIFINPLGRWSKKLKLKTGTAQNCNKYASKKREEQWTTWLAFVEEKKPNFGVIKIFNNTKGLLASEDFRRMTYAS